MTEYEITLINQVTGQSRVISVWANVEEDAALLAEPDMSLDEYVKGVRVLEAVE